MIMVIAVILSGCGVFDGSEIQEAVLTLKALSSFGYRYQCLAPDRSYVPIDHYSKDQESATRNLLSESARIARGDILALSEASPEDYEAAVFPGGFGVAKNLSNFAEKTSQCIVDKETLMFAQAMAAAKKPQGFLCIAPILMPAIYGQGIRLTVGNDNTTIDAIEAMGGVHVVAKVNEAVVDESRRAVSSPAYMLAQSILEVDQSVEALVSELHHLIQQPV